MGSQAAGRLGDKIIRWPIASGLWGGLADGQTRGRAKLVGCEDRQPSRRAAELASSWAVGQPEQPWNQMDEWSGGRLCRVTGFTFWCERRRWSQVEHQLNSPRLVRVGNGLRPEFSCGRGSARFPFRRSGLCGKIGQWLHQAIRVARWPGRQADDSQLAGIRQPGA